MSLTEINGFRLKMRSFQLYIFRYDNFGENDFLQWRSLDSSSSKMYFVWKLLIFSRKLAWRSIFTKCLSFQSESPVNHRHLKLFARKTLRVKIRPCIVFMLMSFLFCFQRSQAYALCVQMVLSTKVEQKIF